MTRKDFELIARAVRSVAGDAPTRVAIARALADELATTNRAFDRQRFLDAALG